MDEYKQDVFFRADIIRSFENYKDLDRLIDDLMSTNDIENKLLEICEDYDVPGAHVEVFLRIFGCELSISFFDSLENKSLEYFLCIIHNAVSDSIDCSEIISFHHQVLLKLFIEAYDYEKMDYIVDIFSCLLFYGYECGCSMFSPVVTKKYFYSTNSIRYIYNFLLYRSENITIFLHEFPFCDSFSRLLYNNETSTYWMKIIVFLMSQEKPIIMYGSFSICELCYVSCITENEQFKCEFLSLLISFSDSIILNVFIKEITTALVDIYTKGSITTKNKSLDCMIQMESRGLDLFRYITDANDLIKSFEMLEDHENEILSQKAQYLVEKLKILT